MKIRIGTKDADISLTRAEALANQLEEQGHETEVIRLPRVGDLESIGQLRLGLLRDDFDVAIHRMNRVPQNQVPGLVIAAMPRRDDNRDALVAREGLPLSGLPEGAVVATGAPLRRAQLNQLHPGLSFQPLKPDLSTCMDMVRDGELDALATSSSDIHVLGREEEISDYLPTVTAPGQGALGYECRSADKELVDLLARFDDPDTRVSVTAERAAKAALDVSEAVSVGARAVREGVLSLRVDVVPHDGSKRLSVQLGMPTSEFHARIIGERAAEALRQMGAEEIGREPRVAPETTDESRPKPTRLADARVLVAREEGHITAELRAEGVQVDAVPLQKREVLDVSSTLDGADWVAFTSERAVASLQDLGWVLPESARIAAVGPSTADDLADLGYEVDLVPRDASGIEALLALWPEGEGTVMVPGSALLAPGFIASLQEKGYTAHLVPIYTMTQAPHAPFEVREAWDEGLYDAVVVLSGSNALAVGQLLGWNPAVPVVAVGESAGRVLERAGVTVAATSDSYLGSDVVQAVRAALDLPEE